MTEKQDWVPLARAAQRLRCSWHTAYNHVLRGDVRAMQTPTGRWLIQRESLERLAPPDNAA